MEALIKALTSAGLLYGSSKGSFFFFFTWAFCMEFAFTTGDLIYECIVRLLVNLKRRLRYRNAFYLTNHGESGEYRVYVFFRLCSYLYACSTVSWFAHLYECIYRFSFTFSYTLFVFLFYELLNISVHHFPRIRVSNSCFSKTCTIMLSIRKCLSPAR